MKLLFHSIRLSRVEQNCSCNSQLTKKSSTIPRFNIRDSSLWRKYSQFNPAILSLFLDRHVVAQLIKALRYKPAGRGFDSRRCHWHNLSVSTMDLGSTQPLTGGKGGRCVELSLPPSCVYFHDIWEPQGLPRPVKGLLYLRLVHSNYVSFFNLEGQNFACTFYFRLRIPYVAHLCLLYFNYSHNIRWNVNKKLWFFFPCVIFSIVWLSNKFGSNGRISGLYCAQFESRLRYADRFFPPVISLQLQGYSLKLC